MRLPYFTLQPGQDREIIATGGGYYDLSNQQFLQQVTQAVLDRCWRSTICATAG